MSTTSVFVPRPLWTIAIMARILQATPNAIYKLVDRGLIPHVRLGRKIFFDPAAIRDWIDRHKVPGDPRR